MYVDEENTDSPHLWHDLWRHPSHNLDHNFEHFDGHNLGLYLAIN